MRTQKNALLTILALAVLVGGVAVAQEAPTHQDVRHEQTTEEEGIALDYLQQNIDALAARQVRILKNAAKRLQLGEADLVSWDPQTKSLKVVTTVRDAVAPVETSNKP